MHIPRKPGEQVEVDWAAIMAAGFYVANISF